MGLGPGVASLPLHPAQQVAVRGSDSAHPNFFFVQSFCKYVNLVKSISFKPYLGIQSILYEILSEKCVESEYAIHTTVCILHHVVTWYFVSHLIHNIWSNWDMPNMVSRFI
jgi:hypothetical protein